MPITKGSSVLVAEAMAQVKTYTVPEVLARLHDPKVQIVDIRDVRELACAALHAGVLGGPGIALLQTSVGR
jgi:hypothetical protein